MKHSSHRTLPFYKAPQYQSNLHLTTNSQEIDPPFCDTSDRVKQSNMRSAHTYRSTEMAKWRRNPNANPLQARIPRPCLIFDCVPASTCRTINHSQRCSLRRYLLERGTATLVTLYSTQHCRSRQASFGTTLEQSVVGLDALLLRGSRRMRSDCIKGDIRNIFSGEKVRHVEDLCQNRERASAGCQQHHAAVRQCVNLIPSFTSTPGPSTSRVN